MAVPTLAVVFLAIMPLGSMAIHLGKARRHLLSESDKKTGLFFQIHVALHMIGSVAIFVEVSNLVGTVTGRKLRYSCWVSAVFIAVQFVLGILRPEDGDVRKTWEYCHRWLGRFTHILGAAVVTLAVLELGGPMLGLVGALLGLSTTSLLALFLPVFKCAAETIAPHRLTIRTHAAELGAKGSKATSLVLVLGEPPESSRLSQSISDPDEHVSGPSRCLTCLVCCAKTPRSLLQSINVTLAVAAALLLVSAGLVCAA